VSLDELLLSALRVTCRASLYP